MTSNQKKLDFATIVIIAVSVILILSGIFLLNKDHSKQSSQITINSIQASPQKSSIIYSQIINSSSTIASLQSKSSNSSSSAILESSSTTTSNIVLSSISSTLSSKVNSKLLESDAVVKVNAIAGTKYTIEVLDTGYIEGKFWRIGNKFEISLVNFEASIGKEYKLSGVTEKGNSTSFELISNNK